MAAVAPFILNKPAVLIGATPIELHCYASEIHTNVDQDENENKTFCGTYTNFGPEVWDITLTAYSSFGTDGLWNVVRPLVGTTQPFVILPDREKPRGPANPTFEGNAIVKAFPFLDGAVGEASEFDFVLAVQGSPTSNAAAGAAATGAVAGIPGYFTPIGATPPATFTALTTPTLITASPATSWTTGQYVQTATAGSSGQGYWNGTAWAAGVKP